MGCLTAGQIYLFLEGELLSDERTDVQKHLDACPKCRDAVEERRIFLQAANSLPLFEVPSDFTQQVMTRIFPERAPFRAWVKAIAGGLAATVFAFLLFYIFSGQNLADLFVNINQFFLSAFRTLSTGAVKLFKLIWHLFNIILQFFGFLFKGISQLTTIVSPEVQAGIIAIVLLTIALIFIGVRRKLLMGEKI